MQAREQQEQQQGPLLELRQVQVRYHQRLLVARRPGGHLLLQLPDAQVYPTHMSVSKAMESAETKAYIEQVLHGAVGVVEARA